MPVSLRVSHLNKVGRALLCSALVLGVLSVIGFNASVADAAEPNNNPDLPVRCGLDIVLVLDASSSLRQNGQTYYKDVRDASEAFLNAFQSTNTRLAVTYYDRTDNNSNGTALGDAGIDRNGAALSYNSASDQAALPFTDIDATTNSPAGVFDHVLAEYDKYSSGTVNGLDGAVNSGTNWEAGLQQAQAILPSARAGVPQLVVHITDGQPTKSVSAGSDHVDNAVDEANAIKASGTHIYTVGVGAALANGGAASPQVANLKAVSGNEVFDLDANAVSAFRASTDDVILTSDFAKLEQMLAQVARDLCSPSLTITKQAQSENSEVFEPAAGWDFTVTPTGFPADYSTVLPTGDASQGPRTATTDAGGRASFQWNFPTGTNGNETLAISETARDGFTFSELVCTRNGIVEPTIVPVDGLASVPMGRNDIVTCDALNSFDRTPGIAVVKWVDKDLVRAGDGVVYSYLVTNVGNTKLLDVTISDDKCSPVTFVSGDANGDSILDQTEEWLYRCEQALDVDTVNTVVVGATDPFGTSVDATDQATVSVINPAINLVKTVDHELIPTGDEVTYTYTVTNTGDVALKDVNVVDDKCSPVAYVSGDANGDSVLDLDETWILTCAQSLDVDTTNVATVTGTDPLGSTVDSTDEAYVEVINPGISIVKTVDEELIHAGDEVTYTYVVSNTGDDALANVNVVDDKCSAVTYVSGDADENGLLDLDEYWTYTCDQALDSDTTNTAVVTGTDSLGRDLTDSDTAFVAVIAPGINIVKTVDKNLIHAGDAVVYNYDVTNTGVGALADVAVSDDKCSPVIYVSGDLNKDDKLDVDETWIYRCGQTLDIDTTNVATVTGVDELGLSVSATDDAFVDVLIPSIDVVKSVNDVNPIEGDEITFTYVVINTGDAPLSNVAVTDDVLGAIGTVDSLAPGESATLTKSQSVTLTQPRVNVATATGTDQLGLSVNDTDDAEITVTPKVVVIATGAKLPFTGVESRTFATTALAMLLLGAAVSVGASALRRREMMTD